MASKVVDYTLEKHVAEYQQDPDFLAEQIALEVVEDAFRLMTASNMTQADLARKLGVSRARISRILNAHPNLTLRSIALLGLALGAKPYAGLSQQSPETTQNGKSRPSLKTGSTLRVKPHLTVPVTVPTPSR
ncbi:MAG: XRE family transcriptional regulator [Dehalococcoidia bacterium]|nr:XRE family transcriptional regulator [Dehalococcoidia bacterium]